MTEEKILYENNTVRITNSRAIFGDTTYPIAHITSTFVKTIPPNLKLSTFLILWGIFCLLIFCGVTYTLFNASYSDVWGMIIFDIILAIFTALIIGAGIYTRRKARPTYALIIRSSSGELQALSSNNNAYIQKVVTAINQAIVDRG